PKEIRSRRRAWIGNQRRIRDGVIRDKTHDGMSLAEQLHQVGLEDHADAMEQRAFSVPANTQQFPNATVCAVRCDQVLGANNTLVSTFPFAYRGCDTMLILREGDQFSPKTQFATKLFGPGAQDWFQQILRNLAASRRACVTYEERFNIFLQHIK